MIVARVITDHRPPFRTTIKGGTIGRDQARAEGEHIQTHETGRVCVNLAAKEGRIGRTDARSDGGRGRRRKLGFSSSPASRPYQATTYASALRIACVTLCVTAICERRFRYARSAPDHAVGWRATNVGDESAPASPERSVSRHDHASDKTIRGRSCSGGRESERSPPPRPASHRWP